MTEETVLVNEPIKSSEHVMSKELITRKDIENKPRLETYEEKIAYLESIGARPKDIYKKNPHFLKMLLERVRCAVYTSNPMNPNSYFFEEDQKRYREEHFAREIEKEKQAKMVTIPQKDLEKLKQRRVRKKTIRSK